MKSKYFLIAAVLPLIIVAFIFFSPKLELARAGTDQSGNSTSDTATCPTGTIWNSQNEVCESVSPICPTGTTFAEEASGLCITSPTCPSGQTFSGVTQNSSPSCSGGAVGTCPGGTTWGTSYGCFTYPVCPSGTVLYDGYGAVCISTPTCPSGTILTPGTDECQSTCTGEAATCPASTVWNPVFGTCESVTQVCSTNTILDEPIDMCVTEPTCPAGEVPWISSPTVWCCQPQLANCAVQANPTCPSGMFWNGIGQCEGRLTCPSGTKYNASYDACFGNPTCPSGTTLTPGTDECQGSSTCPSDTDADANSCTNCCLCLYQDVSTCAQYSSPSDCAKAINPDTQIADCTYDNASGKCISRFKEYCINDINNYNTANPNAQCTVFSDSIQADPSLSYQTTIVIPKQDLITAFKTEHGCNNTNFNYFEEEHGTVFDNPELGATIQACISGATCTSQGAGCNINIVKSSCLTFQDQAGVQTLATAIQQTLINNGLTTTTVTVTANQASAAKNIVETPETITITSSGISYSFPDCSTMTSQPCLGSYETAYCSSDEGVGEPGQTLEYLCCGAKPLSSGLVSAGAWQYISNPNSFCSGDTVTQGFIQGTDCDDNTAWNNYAAERNKLEDYCKGKGGHWVMPDNHLTHGKNGDLYYYSQSWQCATSS